MARIIMLQKRNTNWLSRKIEAQRERSGVRGKGLEFGGRGFGVPPTNGPGWLQGYPLTIPDTPSLLLLTAHFWYYNFRLSGSSTRRTPLLISDFPLKQVVQRRTWKPVLKLSTLSYPLSLLIVFQQKCINHHSVPVLPTTPFLQSPMRAQVPAWMRLRQRGRRMHTSSRSCTSHEKHTLWASF